VGVRLPVREDVAVSDAVGDGDGEGDTFMIAYNTPSFEPTNTSLY
jgi:hypothetical protein